MISFLEQEETHKHHQVILQLKKGFLEADYFQQKFDVDILEHWAATWKDHNENGFLEITDRGVELTRKGLLHADALLPPFFEEQFQNVRYT